LERSRFRQGGLEGVRIRRGRSVRASRGFTFVEVLVVIIIFGLLVAIAGPVAGKWIRRSEDMAALASARQVLAVARLEAVRRSTNIVVEISLSPENRIRLRTFQDRANDTTSPLPGSSTIPPTDEALAAGNCIQDLGAFATSPTTDEPTLGDVSLSPRIHFWKHGGNKDDVADAVRFDTYLDSPDSGNTSCAASTDRIIFLPSGGISTPQDSGSGPNKNTTADERGIYFADWQGKNYFRVTIESDRSGKAQVEKYVGSGYVASGWQWQ
jgi:prepilin-type N-terminal cleavage/methylation domain-containing protein